MNIAIIFAGGSGIRMGAGIPKQFLEINGKPILIHTMHLFQHHHEIDKIYAAVQEDYIDYVKDLADEFRVTKLAKVVAGGESAQDSIYHALKAAAEENPPDSIVLIHDGVRPFVAYDVISKNIESVKKYGNAITSTPCFETILVSKDGRQVDSVPYRKETFSGQAPQSFYLQEIIESHEKIQATETGYENMVDACTIIRTLGQTAYLVEGNRGNIKVTTPEDVYLLRALLQYQENEQAFGFGITNHIGRKLPDS
ncbi:MAG: 2-C-methyl-D-erythritol 4-phosphate cytidylyltransferase [Lachnospiraceae bacterium]|nr:2-C-methyl-D-erythritol 4-phosphate cytidylyltransferase [Lachnospiraceae bacterium]